MKPQIVFIKIQKDYEHETSSYRKFLKIKSDKFFNALSKIFLCYYMSQILGAVGSCIYRTALLPNGINEDYLRWLYTAVTEQKKPYI